MVAKAPSAARYDVSAWFMSVIDDAMSASSTFESRDFASSLDGAQPGALIVEHAQADADAGLRDRRAAERAVQRGQTLADAGVVARLDRGDQRGEREKMSVVSVPFEIAPPSTEVWSVRRLIDVHRDRCGNRPGTPRRRRPPA